MYGLLNEPLLWLVRAWAPYLPSLYSVRGNVLVSVFFLSSKTSSAKDEFLELNSEGLKPYLLFSVLPLYLV